MAYISEFIPDTMCAKYELYSVIEHFGTTEGGHYTNMSARDGVWYRFDDNNVSRIGALPEYSNSGHLLAYTRIRK